MKLYFCSSKVSQLLYLLLSSILTGIQAANIDIQWAIQTYDDTTAQVGDTITFTWSSGHNVYIQPSGTCQADGAILVGETSPAIYTFTANDEGQDLFFVCGVEGHCAAGQTITVSITAATAANTEVSTNVPTDNGGTSGSDIPTDFSTGTPTAAPMEAEGNNGGSSSIPSIGPSTMGGGSTTQPPTSASGGTTITMTSSTIVTLLFVLTVSTVALAIA